MLKKRLIEHQLHTHHSKRVSRRLDVASSSLLQLQKRYIGATTSSLPHGSNAYRDLQSSLLELQSLRDMWNYQCDTCPYTSAEIQHLHQHEKVHLKGAECAFPCPICGIVYANRGSRTRHMRVHPGYLATLSKQCRLCYKRFDTDRRLELHLLTHTADREYWICGYCFKRFKYANSRRRHVKNKHPGARKRK